VEAPQAQGQARAGRGRPAVGSSRPCTDGVSLASDRLLVRSQSERRPSSCVYDREVILDGTCFFVP
jgi:hypothetical protein